MSSNTSFDIHDYVYEGVWQDYRDPAFRRWVWTLRDAKALAILAALTALLMFTQSRAWILIRYLIFRQVEPLTDHGLRLSQGNALRDTFPSCNTIKAIMRLLIRKPWAVITGQISLQSDNDDPPDSPWFGIGALLNIIVFLTMGIAIPFLLSNDSLKTPIVRSKATQSCSTSFRTSYLFDIIGDLPQIDAITGRCFDRSIDSCASEYFLQKPQIRKSRLENCPFPEDICDNSTKPIEIIHEGITPYEVGVNSLSKIAMNHRLTCVPVYLDKFYLFDVEHTTPITIKKAYITAHADKQIRSGFSIILRTLNGPNIFSHENSGYRMAKEKGPYDLTVLPTFWGSSEASAEEYHPSIRVTDAMSFLVLHRAGTAQYLRAMDDPFFSAHSEVHHPDNNLTSFFADREVTAMACLEQFQFCHSGTRNCTEWGKGSSPLYSPVKGLTKIDVDSISEIFTLHRYMPYMFAVYDYLAQRIRFHDMVPLTRTRPGAVPRLPWNTQDQWITEVETWIMKAILGGIIYARYGAQFSLGRESDFARVRLESKYLLCGRILFRHGDYTNINWVGLCATTGSLLFICVLSYTIEATGQAAIFICWLVKKEWRVFRACHHELRRRVKKWLSDAKSWELSCHFQLPQFGRWWRGMAGQSSFRAPAQTELDDVDSRPHAGSDP